MVRRLSRSSSLNQRNGLTRRFASSMNVGESAVRRAMSFTTFSFSSGDSWSPFASACAYSPCANSRACCAILLHGLALKIGGQKWWYHAEVMYVGR